MGSDIHLLAADPGGSSGGLAIVEARSFELRLLEAMPRTPAEVGARVGELVELYRPVRAVVEAVSAGGKRTGGEQRMGAQSAFVFGSNFGALQAALAALGVPVDLPTPLTWRRRLGIKDGSGKEGAMAIAVRHWPARRIAKRYGDTCCLAAYARLLWVAGAGEA